MKAMCHMPIRPLDEFECGSGDCVVDALYGAGLSRGLPQAVRECIAKVRSAGARCIAVDLPSGVSGDSGQALGDAFVADVTVTFARKKPAHLLLPGKLHCGEIIVADIDIPSRLVEEVGVGCFENNPALWGRTLPRPAVDTHKYSRGHVAVFSGGPSSTGAARLSAMAAARIGAGAVTMLSRSEALAANAAHLTSIILRRADTLSDVREFLNERRPGALVYGPGLGADEKVGRFLMDLLPSAADCRGIVIDADGLTSLSKQLDGFLTAVQTNDAPPLVLTPHEGEFARLCPDLASNQQISKLEKARIAAERFGATVVYKGPDTVIAAPDGRTAINGNGSPHLATAGSGDVLSGLIAGLLAQSMPPFGAACAAVWIHAEAARRFGVGLIAEDLPLAIRPVLRTLYLQP
jgi:hydroxyethylthiazole kinase-like uncharacterized protein yjeF